MESAANAFPFTSLCAHRYWKSEAAGWLAFPVYSRRRGDEWWQNQNSLEDVMRHGAIRLCLIISDWVSSCLFHSAVVRLRAHEKPRGENCVGAQQRCIGAISTNGIVSRAAVLSTSGAKWRRWEHYQMCLSSPHQRDPGGRCRYWVTFSAWLPDINAISRLITMGTFHRVLGLINDFFLGFHLSSPFATVLLPCSPRSPCSWADNPTSPGARPP